MTYRGIDDGRGRGTRIPFGMIGGVVLAVVAFFFGITVAFGSWYTIDQTERGVILRNGAISGIAQPGFGFKLPMLDGIEKITMKTQTFTWDKMDSYSFDQQQAHLKVSVTVRAVPERVGSLYTSFGSLTGAINNLLTPHVPQQTKVVFGQYTAVRAIQQRAKLNSDIRDAINGSLPVDAVLSVESVQLENIDFSVEYLRSIEKRMLAEVEVQQIEQNALREKVQATITVIKANAEADAVLANAKANAEAIKLRGAAEATAIQARGDALTKNPSLPALVQAERWNGVLPTTMIPGGAVPMLGIAR